MLLVQNAIIHLHSLFEGDDAEMGFTKSFKDPNAKKIHILFKSLFPKLLLYILSWIYIGAVGVLDLC